jgi:hypothetical protein
VKYSKAAAVVVGSLAMLGAAAPAFAQGGLPDLSLVKGTSKVLSSDSVGRLASHSQLDKVEPLVGQAKRMLKKADSNAAVKTVKAVSPLGALPIGG